eukprot:7772151-Lingulodinium_polyedra.AAC.1
MDPGGGQATSRREAFGFAFGFLSQSDRPGPWSASLRRCLASARFRGAVALSGFGARPGWLGVQR